VLALWALYGKEIGFVRPKVAEAANVDPNRYKKWFWKIKEDYRYMHNECVRENIEHS